MIQSASLFTYELDDPALALEELQSQLAQKLTLRQNTVGILQCDPEFLASGVFQAVCAGLPFPVAGTTTMSQAVNGEAGALMLTLLVLTSDDAVFEAGLTSPMAGDILSATRPAYEAALARLGTQPRLILVFPPLLLENAGDQYIDALEALCPGVPIFGTIAVEDSLDYARCASFANGEHGHRAMSFVLVGGQVSPRFFVATIPESRLLPYRGEITRAEGNLVHEINGVPAADYFESIGLAQNGVIDDGVQFVPFILHMKKQEERDPVPVVRAMVRFNENGSAICRGYMYEQSVFALSTFEKEGVLKTTLQLVDTVNRLEDAQAVLLFSCLVRRMAFATEPLVEAQQVVQAMRPDVPFMMGYSGGEICPTGTFHGLPMNRFHNYSLIACVL